MGVYAFLYELIIKRTTELREKPLLARDENTLHAKQRPPKLTRSGGCIALHPTSVSSPFLGPSLARSREVRPKRRACSQAMSRPVECRSLKRILKRAHWVRFPVLSPYWLLSIHRPFRCLIPVACERIGNLNTSLIYAGLMACSLISQLTDGWCLTLSKAFQKSIVKSRTCTASVIAAVIYM